MTEEALKALKLSIEHWERIASGKMLKTEGIGASHCALCDLFRFNPTTKLFCRGCPVSEKTGLSGCVGSPHAGVCHAFEKSDTDNPYESKKFKAAARKELKFLKSLLPK